MSNFRRDYFDAFSVKPRECMLCHSFTNLIDLVRVKIYDWGFITHKICTNCGLIMIDPKPSKDATESYYRHYGEGLTSSNIDGGDKYSILSWKDKFNAFTNHVEFLKRQGFIPSGKKLSIFEVGAGAGILMKVLHQHFDIGFAAASEPGGGYDDVFKHFNPKASLFKSTLFYEESNLSSKSFDLIYFYGVFEHVYSPEKMLSGIRSKLSDDGLIWGMIPNSWCPIKSPDWWFPWDHYYSYNKLTIRQLFEKNGFEVLLIDNSVSHYMMQIVAKKTEKASPALNFSNNNVREFVDRINAFISLKGQPYNLPASSKFFLESKPV